MHGGRTVLEKGDSAAEQHSLERKYDDAHISCTWTDPHDDGGVWLREKLQGVFFFGWQQNTWDFVIQRAVELKNEG